MVRTTISAEDARLIRWLLQGTKLCAQVSLIAIILSLCMTACATQTKPNYVDEDLVKEGRSYLVRPASDDQTKTENEKIANALFEKAADGGNTDAAYELCISYTHYAQRGGIPETYATLDKGMDWCAISADLGNQDAQQRYAENKKYRDAKTGGIDTGSDGGQAFGATVSLIGALAHAL